MPFRDFARLACATALALPLLALAQGPQRGDDDHGKAPEAHGAPAQGAPPHAAPRRAPVHAVRDEHPDQRGAGPDHAFRQGQRLTGEYTSRQYVVDDWQNHHLNAPPRGYHWVQTGSDYVLVAIASGIIAQVLLDQ